jgi:hypothetical protein
MSTTPISARKQNVARGGRYVKPAITAIQGYMQSVPNALITPLEAQMVSMNILTLRSDWVQELFDAF